MILLPWCCVVQIGQNFDPTGARYSHFHCCRNRSFSIDSLDVGTLELSRNFLERYRTRRLIQELIDGSDTPIQNRNIDWLVNQYLAQVIPMDKYLRIIYNPHIPNPVHNKRGDLVLKKPRHIRKVHKPQIREIFARQAEWLLADQIASSSPNARYLNIVEWRNFVLQVKIARREARAQNQRWGEPWNEEMHGDWAIEEGIDLTRFGGTWQEWQRLLRNALHNPIPWQQRKEIFKVMSINDLFLDPLMNTVLGTKAFTLCSTTCCD